MKSVLLCLLCNNLSFALNLDDLKSYKLYLNEICSFNGKPTIDAATDTVVCQCQREYTTFNKEARTIRGQLIQCNYPLKRRFIALFFSIFLPCGFEYIYLMHYLYFAICFVVVIFLCAVLTAYFLVSNGYSCSSRKNQQVNTFSSQSLKDKRKESKKALPVSSEAKEVKETQSKNEEADAYPAFKVVTILFVIVCFLAWFVNIGLIAAGVVYDANGVPTLNDLSFLINVSDG